MFAMRGNIDVGLQRRLRGQPDRTLGNAGGLVSHALEIVRRLHAHDDQPKLRGDWRPQVHVGNRFIVDLHLQAINLVVSRNDLVGERRVSIHQSLQRQTNLTD